MLPTEFLAVLRKIHASLVGSHLDWAVTGSLGMALQGMGLTVHDIDLQTDETGAYEIGRRLGSFVVTPVRFVESERARSHLGRLVIDGIQVEVIGAIQKRLGDGTWELPVQVGKYKHWVDLDGLAIPVLSLEYEYEAYRLMGRTEQADRIRLWLDKQARR